MTFDPYQELNISTNATPAQVKAAYRKRAKKAHPDSGGTSEDFQRLSRAMLVLSDPVRRAKYDRTGEIDESTPDNAVALAVSLIVGYFAAAVAECVKKSHDPCSLDLVAGARSHFEQQIKAFEAQKVPIEKAAKAMERVEKRLKAKKNANPIVRAALLAQMRGTREPLAQLDQKITQFKDALALLEPYAFEIDQTAVPMQQPRTIYNWGLL